MNKVRFQLVSYIGLSIMLLSGCGQKNEVTATQGQSFGSSLAAASTVTSTQTPAPGSSAVPTPSSSVDSSSTSHSDSSPSPDPKSSTSLPIIPGTDSTGTNSNETNKATKEMNAAQQTGGASSTSTQIPAKNEPTKAVSTPSPEPSATKLSTESAKPGSSAKSNSSSASNVINWEQFFDNDKQDTPSESFWDMSGKTVQIKGFMGEVLSFDKHWFLLIPKPGAECPFDNGDETYWNKIMIVFVPDNVKLRYTSGPLMITGKLDVGIKLDESGYKTMFRLYDASFEKIKE
ncbi:hypothetical protein NV379_23980 [Paenibacillus sp. N1-5-1-14]|uniref:hypothetical protein n=1 Tax=Paenibacillus radicibacter TaxID=2972488 RepID=UPI002159500D|nr:hypothetical protein [Paenibacillus radicibacter]MCR8645703.1 hypothetical protein [Paenibacillus radicibacter]